MSSGSDSVYASLGKTDALLHEPFHLRQSSASVIQTLLKQSIQSNVVEALANFFRPPASSIGSVTYPILLASDKVCLVST